MKTAEELTPEEFKLLQEIGLTTLASESGTLPKETALKILNLCHDFYAAQFSQQPTEKTNLENIRIEIKENCPVCLTNGIITHPQWVEYFKIDPLGKMNEQEVKEWFSKNYGVMVLPDEEIECTECKGKGWRWRNIPTESLIQSGYIQSDSVDAISETDCKEMIGEIIIDLDKHDKLGAETVHEMAKEIFNRVKKNYLAGSKVKPVNEKMSEANFRKNVMFKCPECSHGLIETNNFCPSCGSKINWV